MWLDAYVPKQYPCATRSTRAQYDQGRWLQRSPASQRPDGDDRDAWPGCSARAPHLQGRPAMPGFRDALRDLRRRPVRSLLTIAGIAIGVAMLVLLGALSEKL